MNKEVIGKHTAELITGGKKYRLRDWDAMEFAEGLPKEQRWTLQLSNGSKINSDEHNRKLTPHER